MSVSGMTKNRVYVAEGIIKGNIMPVTIGQ
jgi:hypothetical protein